MEATVLNVRFKVIKSVIFFDLLPMLAEGSFFGSFFGCRCHVVEPGEEAAIKVALTSYFEARKERF